MKDWAARKLVISYKYIYQKSPPAGDSLLDPKLGRYPGFRVSS